MADDLLFQTGIEGTDEITSAAEKISSAWTESMNKIDEATKQTGESFAGIGDEMKESLSGAGEHLDNFLGKFGEGGRAIGEFGNSIKSVVSAIGEGGLAGALGAAALAAGGLAIAMAHVGTTLLDLQESTEGTAQDFAHLENTARAIGVSIDTMTESSNRLRDGFRQAGLALQNTGEMIGLYVDRISAMKETAKLAAEAHQIQLDKLQGIDVAAEEASLANEKYNDSVNRQAVFMERAQVRLDRMVRTMKENASGLQRIALIGVDPQDTAHVEQLGEEMEKIGHLTGPEQWVKALDLVKQKIQELGGITPELRRGLNEALGPDMARRFLQGLDQIKDGMSSTGEAAQKLSEENGDLTESQRQNLADLDDELHRLGTAFETAGAKAAAAFGPAVTLALGAIEQFLKDISSLLNDIDVIMSGLTIGGLALASQFHEVAKAVDEWTGNMKGANQQQKEIEDDQQKMLDLAQHLVDTWAKSSLKDTIKFTSDQQGMQGGGMLHGPGSTTSDSIPIMASRGEYVVNAAAVSHYGVGLMNAINARRYQSGGWVDQPVSVTDELGPEERKRRQQEQRKREQRQREAEREQEQEDKLAQKKDQLQKEFIAWLMKRYNESEATAMATQTGMDWALFQALNPGKFQDVGTNFASGGYVGMGRVFGGIAGFAGGGLASGAANVSGGASLHPVNITLPSGRSVGGFFAEGGAVAQISHEAAVRRATSLGRRSSAEG